jgi:hypothetical protein
MKENASPLLWPIGHESGPWTAPAFALPALCYGAGAWGR